ncbi:MAG: TFIIB-type zinc ribbon-containing protein [Bacilli bacterium]|nr:TFIIB-type zinc ribbon-containing protein [Bacilli bacterium]
MNGSNLDNSDFKKDTFLEKNDATKIIQTDVGSKDGQNKCPKCGATDINLNVNNGKLRCNFCRHEFELEKLEEMETDITKLQGQILGSGAQDIVADTQDVFTFKCSSCGAEVVIDTASATQARCHWCRNTLSMNNQIPNGSIPDVVLPFNISKDTAKEKIEEFVGKRKFFAHPKFKEEFTTQNIMGVYFPYMVVDVNSHAKLIGQGEKQIRKYIKGSGSNAKTYYDADLYNIYREFDLAINGLTVESSLDKLSNSNNKTNNVINAIMPFDIENCVKYNANYLKGYTSERRDTNIEQLRTIVDTQAKDVARFKANDTLKEYDRGVSWSSEVFEVKGQQWKAAYLPVWLYSYQQVNGENKILHYVAVNARTKEVMGSVPIHMPKLIGFSLVVELVGILAMIFLDFSYNWLFLLSGIIYFIVMYTRYRNANARHKYETETKSQIFNLSKQDDYVRRLTGLSSSKMNSANNKNVDGQSVMSKAIDSVVENNAVAQFINNNINKNGGNS